MPSYFSKLRSVSINVNNVSESGRISFPLSDKSLACMMVAVELFSVGYLCYLQFN